MDRLQRMLGASGMGGGGGGGAGDAPQQDTSEQIYISSLALLKMLKHGRAGVPLEVMGLMLGEFVDEYTVKVRLDELLLVGSKCGNTYPGVAERLAGAPGVLRSGTVESTPLGPGTQARNQTTLPRANTSEPVDSLPSVARAATPPKQPPSQPSTASCLCPSPLQVVDVFAMPQSGTGVSVEAVDPVFQTKMLDMLKQTGR